VRRRGKTGRKWRRDPGDAGALIGDAGFLLARGGDCANNRRAVSIAGVR